MHETYLKVNGDCVYIRHNKIRPGRQTVLLMHGLGDCSMAFKEAFSSPLSDGFNLLAPDLIGYGRSSVSSSENYGFEFQIGMLWKIIERFRVEDLAVVGHSMGGDIATLMCASDGRGIIKAYVNVEGDITEHDLFISGRVVKAAEQGEFEKWFGEKFLDEIVYEKWGKKLKSSRRYYASLQFCRPEAFLANAREIVSRNTALPGKMRSEIGKTFCSLTLPKVFCYGTRSLPDAVVEFLKENNLAVRVFKDSVHHIMIERTEEFYTFLVHFLNDAPGQG